ncbi:unnamed protein product [Nyctereutes procyonoides]|uniref:(raccoon dog) hypothetical protein n=1 Tax=Nyctereutes procyonoides TaxID=34880 RepID=A0A811Y0Y1_NYCPR|nr:unnamed protein product [Nyctereutes procyonoides]
MQLFVNQELHTLEVTGQEMGIFPEDQVLLLVGMPLEDEATLGQCGGKVHGSLACAGKVRGKTPKTGQTKWQIQYYWCFVNVVPTFGQKKGPNANS